MRLDPVEFALATQAPSKRPRYVIRILFDTDSPACTSHADIPSVPGDVIEAVLHEPAAISQRIVPDEGRSEIGSFSFSLVDHGSAFTNKLRAKLQNDGEGLRGRTVIFYEGYEGFDFSDFQIFQTQVARNVSYDEGSYTVQCADITREQRKDIFEPKVTTLRDSVSDTATTIPVYVTSAFSTIAHGTSWSDAPSSTVGYIRIENEIVRYTGKTSDSFTGCTRGALNTKAVSHAVDAGTAADRRTKVEEYIYLELPAVKLAWAVMTGELYGSANVLPSHWHLGIDTAFLRESDFSGIGNDLWNPSDDAAALILRFEGLKKTDGKRFLEKEIYLLLGCYSPVYSDGTLGLRRLPALLGDAAPAATLTEREITSISELHHDLDGMHNTFRINWNHDVLKNEYTRITLFTDTDSIAIHGPADLKEYSFKGLHGSRHTDAIVSQRIHALRDAYSHPPQRIRVTTHGSMSHLEIGDVVRLQCANVRDFAGNSTSIDRAFAIFQKTHKSSRNEVLFELFGSTARPLARPPGTGSTAPLPNAFYTAIGTSLNSVATITTNVMATGNYTITGHADLNNSAAVFYWDNDLTIPSGCNLTIVGNVQLRIRGFLTLNGTINGVGGGHAGEADPGTGSWDARPADGAAGFVGHSRGWDGIRRNQKGRTAPRAESIAALLVRSQYNAMPEFALVVSGNSLLGLPTDLRGTGGAPGGRLVNSVGSSDTVVSVGTAGADGGAGLCIVCRGMALGAAASINLSGESAAVPTLQSFSGDAAYPGRGGAGGPGAFLLLLDGNAISIPDITGKFFAVTGEVTQPGVPMTQRSGMFWNTTAGTNDFAFPLTDSGYQDPEVVSLQDYSNAAHRIQYVPESQSIDPDEEPVPSPPTNLAAGHVFGGNALFWDNPALVTFDVIEIYASIDNDRANSQRVGESRASSFFHSLPLGGLRYYWIRARRDAEDGRPDTFSDWEPSSPTDGESSNIETPGEVPDAPDDISAIGKVNAIQFQWTLPAYARLAGFLEIFEGDVTDDYEDVATTNPVWSGYGLSAVVAKDDDDDHRYWLVLNRSGIRSDPSPIGGIVASAASVTAALVAYATPESVSRSATLGPNPRFVITPPTEVIANGGTAPYTYAWTWHSGGTGITIDAPSFNDTTFSASGNLDGTILTGTARCTVTDAVSATATADVAVLISFPSVG